MKQCPTCGATLDESFDFCPEDGAGLREITRDPERSDPPDRESGEGAKLVLYCSVCGSEFPPTFELCPTHQTPLIAFALTAKVSADTQDQASREEQPHPVEASDGAAKETKEVQEPLMEGTANVQPRGDSSVSEPLFDQTEPAVEPETPDRSSFSMAAGAVAGLLILLTAAAVISVATSFNRRPAPRASAAVNEPDPQPQSEIYVPTPVQALDFAEDHPVGAEPSSLNTTAPKVLPQITSPGRSDTTNRGNSPDRTTSRRREAPPPQPMFRSQQTIASVLPPRSQAFQNLRLPQSSLVSHLVRVESDRRPFGFHYEVTFSLANESGRQSFLRNLTVVTRSGEGVTRAQTLPFAHRLGPNGSLTFKIGVDLPGRSPNDWRGHVSLVAAGYDSGGETVQTRFAAPLTP